MSNIITNGISYYFFKNVYPVKKELFDRLADTSIDFARKIGFAPIKYLSRDCVDIAKMINQREDLLSSNSCEISKGGFKVEDEVIKPSPRFLEYLPDYVKVGVRFPKGTPGASLSEVIRENVRKLKRAHRNNRADFLGGRISEDNLLKLEKIFPDVVSEIKEIQKIYREIFEKRTKTILKAQTISSAMGVLIGLLTGLPFWGIILFTFFSFITASFITASKTKKSISLKLQAKKEELSEILTKIEDYSKRVYNQDPEKYKVLRQLIFEISGGEIKPMK